MSQDIFSSIDPAISGTDLAAELNDFKDALVSGLSGTARPAELQPGGGWIDTTNDPTTWTYKVWTGVDDVEIFTIDLATGTSGVSLAVDSFTVRKTSADTVGAIVELVKRRIATNGQVLSGDVVAELRIVGRDDSANNPVVAKIIFTADENQTASAYGGTLSFMSTPAGQAAAIEHMRFTGGNVETVVPHKTNADILVSQNVATAATIAQLSAAKVLVEMTGATATEIQGLNSGHASKVVTIHNRSSANVTVMHEDATAAAADRITLPEGRDVVLLPQDSVTLFYCTADTRWKIQYASARFSGFTTDTLYGSVNEWDAPTTVSKARVTAHSRSSVFTPQRNLGHSASTVLDIGKSLYAWGVNTNGELGVGDVVSRSSPVAVLGGLKFRSFTAPFFDSTFGIQEDGTAYAWGYNLVGRLGVGDIIPRSSPVAVLGGFKFKKICSGQTHTIGLAVDGNLYGWGGNANGELGLGDITVRSSPIAVLGGLKFRDTDVVYLKSYGLAYDGSLYAWGQNSSGDLGVGDVTPRSSPVAVLGGLKFKSIVATQFSAYGITEAGAAYAWGLNDHGQLGVGDVIPRSSPVAVLGGLVFKELYSYRFAGGGPFADTFVLGLTEGGAAYAWGQNSHGSLGLGDVTPRSSPVAVLGGLTFEKLGISNSTVYGLLPDGTLYAWGDNQNGEAGLGDVTPRSSPVAVLGGLSFQDICPMISSFGGDMIALTTDGKLYGWGRNAQGEVGDGTITPRSSPVAVLGGLPLKTQDDSDTVLDIPIIGGNTYALKLGSGPCFFGNKPIGDDVYKVEITYVP